MPKRWIRIVGLPPTERSLLAHLLEQHGFSIMEGGPPGLKESAVEAE